LDGDVEGVLQEARWEHVADEFRWYGADTYLAVGEGLAVGADEAVGRDYYF
jgi:hypothetical protein